MALNIKRVIGCIVLALAAAPASQAQTSEPEFSRVKFMTIRGVAKSELAGTCLSALMDEFRRAGLTIRDTTEGADAEMVVDFEFNSNQIGLYGKPDTVSYAFYVSSRPEKKMIWAGRDGVFGDSSGRQCKQLARKLSRNLLKELGERKIDVAVSSEKPNVDPSVVARTALTLGMLEIITKYRGADRALHPIGPVGLRLTCTSPVAFSHQITTSANGHVAFKAPCGKCRLESASPVRVDGMQYVWRSDVEFSTKTTTLDLLGETASAQDATGAPSEGDTSTLVPAAAAGGVEPILPTRDVVLPVLIVSVEPEYPDVAKKALIQGKVILQAVVGVDGLVREITVLTSSNPMFNNPSIQAVSQRMYRPALQDGKPVAIYFTVRTDFAFR